MTIEEPAYSSHKLITSLIGDRIKSVIYHEIDYENDQPHYLAVDRHTLDYGLELHLVSERIVSFIWKWPVWYYLGVISGNLSQELSDGHATWNVSREKHWIELIDHQIRSAHLVWFEDSTVDGHFPYAVKLTFEPSHSVYVSIEVADDPSDHITVLFSDETARKYNRYIEKSGLITLRR